MTMYPTDIKNPEYFHKVVDCQHACPAHTPVPEYIRLMDEPVIVLVSLLADEAE